MDWLINLFSINNIFVNVFGYPLSYLEAVAVVACVAGIWLAAKGKVLNFFFGFISTSLYFVFFYQAHLYSSMALQLMFIAFNVYGYFQWTRPKQGQANADDELKVTATSGRAKLISVVVIVTGTLLWGYIMANPPAIIASEFADAKFPYIDSFVMVASIVAQYLLAKKKFENWIIWIVVDVVATGLYAASGATFTAILYAVLVLIASQGLYDWHKMYKNNK